MPEQLDEEELADWRAGRDAVYQLAALAIGERLTVADDEPECKGPLLIAGEACGPRSAASAK